MRYIHTTVRVRDLEESLDFYCNKLGLVEPTAQSMRLDDSLGFSCSTKNLDTARATAVPSWN